MKFKYFFTSIFFLNASLKEVCCTRTTFAKYHSPNTDRCIVILINYPPKGAQRAELHLFLTRSSLSSLFYDLLFWTIMHGIFTYGPLTSDGRNRVKNKSNKLVKDLNQEFNRK